RDRGRGGRGVGGAGRAPRADAVHVPRARLLRGPRERGRAEDARGVARVGRVVPRDGLPARADQHLRRDERRVPPGRGGAGPGGRRRADGRPRGPVRRGPAGDARAPPAARGRERGEQGPGPRRAASPHALDHPRHDGVVSGETHDGDGARTLAGQGPVVVALDVGGTDIKAALVDADGVLLEQVTPTRAAQGPQASFAAVLAAVEDVRRRVPAGRAVVAVGLAVPGTVDEEAGVVLSAENLDWVDLPVRALVEEATGLPVGFGHDVRAGGLAEWRLGAARGAHDHAFLAVGTGIAAAVVLRGEPYPAHGWAGEVGHGGARDGEPCPCGGRGCAETFASAAGMARTYRRLTGASVADVPGAREVLARAQAGDEVARGVWDRGVDRLGE